jgi:DNA-binding response OmpR family regulator
VAKILVVDDDEFGLEMVATSLQCELYTVEVATDGESALQMLKLNEYDLLICDWSLPKVSGIDICKRFRSAGGRTPILLITGKGQTAEKVIGFDAGADDYLTKPFDLAELLARVKALLRRASPNMGDGALVVGALELDPNNYSVKKDTVEIKLIPKEFAILEMLMRYPNKVFSAEAIINRVWQIGESPSPDVVRTHIKNLRRKLGDDSLIETVHSVGYRLNAPATQTDRGQSNAVTN